MGELLTVAEQAVVKQAGELWGAICSVVEDGPTRDADLHELIVHIHAIQQAVMSNAAGRAYPTQYRRLGSTLTAALTTSEPGQRDGGDSA